MCVAPLSIAVARAMFLIGDEGDAQFELQRSLEILGWTRYNHSWTWWPVPVTHVKRAVEVVNHQNNVLKPLGVTYRPNFVRRLDHVFMVCQISLKNLHFDISNEQRVSDEPLCAGNLNGFQGEVLI